MVNVAKCGHQVNKGEGMIYFVLFFLLLSGCVTPTPDFGVPAESSAELKPQMPFSVDGVKYEGAATVQRATSSSIEITLPAKTILLIASTCARQEEFWQPDNSKTFKYKYIPASFVENVGACPLSFIAVTASGEWHRAIIDFTNAPKDPLPTTIMCNGVWSSLNKMGAAICSVREGKPVRVNFETKSVIARDPNSKCADPKQIGTKEWEIPVTKGFCVYVALNATQEFRLTTYGYSSFLRVYPAKEKG
jgi:hypothetical protein